MIAEVDAAEAETKWADCEIKAQMAVIAHEAATVADATRGDIT